jgi:hypothetical protein
MASPLLDLNDSSIKSYVYAKTNIGGWFFDAYLKMTHTSTLTITDQPVQTGASLTDHAYLQPQELQMDIGMSDVAKSFIPGQFGNSSLRSVTAYQVLRQLQALRVPIQIYTRLYTYENMLVEVISAPDDYTTQFGMKCTVTFREILVAQVTTVKISARPAVTNSINGGSPLPVTPNQSILKQAAGLFFGSSA